VEYMAPAVAKIAAMKLLDRYLGRAVIAGTVLALCVLVPISAFIDFIDELEDVGEHGYTLLQAFYRTLLTLPQGIYEFFPTAALLGGVLGLGNLAINNELVVLRAAGVSIAHIIGSVLKAGTIMMLVVVFIGEVIAPASLQRAQDVKKWTQMQRTSLVTQDGLWAKDGNRFINIKEVLPGLRLRNIHIYVIDDAQRLVAAISAVAAVYRGGRWLMTDVSHSKISPARVITERSAYESWSRLLAPELFRVITIKPEDMSAWKLAEYIHYLKANHLAAQSYELAFWTRFTTPLSSLVMLLLALPFVFGPMGSGGTGQRLFIGIMIGLAFHLFNRALNHLALVYGLDPLLGAILPLMVFILGGGIAIARMR
jgi:lipopolysaccharide export system permease protein